LHLGTPESHGLSSLSSRKNTKNTRGPPSPLMQWLCGGFSDQAYGVRRLGAIP
jgi:hypothetical protein